MSLLCINTVSQLPFLFLQHLCFLLTNFNKLFAVTIRNDQAHIWNKIY